MAVRNMTQEEENGVKNLPRAIYGSLQDVWLRNAENPTQAVLDRLRATGTPVLDGPKRFALYGQQVHTLFPSVGAIPGTVHLGTLVAVSPGVVLFDGADVDPCWHVGSGLVDALPGGMFGLHLKVIPFDGGRATQVLKVRSTTFPLALEFRPRPKQSEFTSRYGGLPKMIVAQADAFIRAAGLYQ